MKKAKHQHPDYTINTRLFDDYLERMNFLNEVSIINPHAISFGSGRPDKDFFDVRQVISCFHGFADDYGSSGDGTVNVDGLYNSLGQYNKTKGIINDSIARLLANDEQITADPEDIVMTDGAQEGMAIVINSLFEGPDDVLLVSDPSYIGFVGYAKIYGVPISPVRRQGDSIDLEHLESVILELKEQGKNPKVLYEVIDFHNPTAAYMPLEKRKQLIELAEKYNFFIVEDNPYGYFIYDGEKIPTLKALDRYRRVIYLGSFSKTIFPAIRLAYLVVDQEVMYKGQTIKLSEEFKKTKSFTTVNTSPVLQAMAGGFLRQRNFSLVESTQPKIQSLRNKRDAMLGVLESHFPGGGSGEGPVRWSKPAGGFFLVVDVPFKITNPLLKQCVDEYGVIFCPMSFFCLNEEVGARQIRLAFSNLGEDRIREGMERLCTFIKDNIGLSEPCLEDSRQGEKSAELQN